MFTSVSCGSSWSFAPKLASWRARGRNESRIATETPHARGVTGPSLSKRCTSLNGPRRMRRRSKGTPVFAETLRLSSFLESCGRRSICARVIDGGRVSAREGGRFDAGAGGFFSRSTGSFETRRETRARRETERPRVGRERTSTKLW